MITPVLMGLTLSGASPAFSQTGGPAEFPVMTACPAREPVRLDGSLSERGWEDAQPVSQFFQRELVEGAPATEKTEVRILFDAENLYIGITCFDSEPDRILRREMQRDAYLRDDDNFAVVIDTFQDRRNAYYFSTNPNGARNDALVSGGNSSDDWNGVWDAAARVTDFGWTAEMVIPFKTLRFSKTEGQDWGINFRRIIRRKHEEVLWTSWGRNDGLLQLSKCGALTGLGNPSRSRQIDFKPFALGGLEKTAGVKMGDNVKYGLDVKYPVTSQLTLDLTTFTDFAQVESDREEINLTRFSINYPEKREFFLEGADIFQFASSNTTPFYSRRIGLTEDRKQVRILGGAKLVGKSGKYNIGVIDMQTDDENGFPSANHAVVRVKRDILRNSYIGFIGTNYSNTKSYDSQTYGADFLYKTDSFLGNQNYEFGGYLANDRDPRHDSGTRAGRLFMTMDNDQYEIELLYHAVGKHYTPDVGYVRRGGIRQSRVSFEYTPRVSLPHVKKLLFKPFGMNYYTDSGSRLQTREMSFQIFGLLFNSDDRIELNAYGVYERLDRDFQIYGDVVIPRGGYEWWDYELELMTSESRPVYFETHAHRGDFYNGTRVNINSTVGVKTSRYYAFEADMTYNDITVSGRNFVTREYGGRVVLNFTTRLNASTLVQYNNDTNEVNMNFRLHFIPQIGSDVYLVYNQLWDEEDRFRSLHNAGIFKVAYLVQF